ncbi:MAG TPA: substrate-binding domain-containing protein [Rhizobiaceae bacterium]|nr:substrate-binding domain-containing protein [Rhizobiaceae bacterium]
MTTVSQPPDDMIEATITTLLEQIEKRAVRKRATVLPARLVIRGSTRNPR